ncbi:MAG TPA: carboxymuconolactone decarboxylase family protein [Vicinamibacterales bacterium]|jgi:uncharacterized peroxidase-related enzyme
MTVLNAIDPKHATGRTKELFGTLEQALGRVPTMIRIMAQSPSVLETYLHFNHALEQSTLSPRTRALITVAIAEVNRCDYTLSLGMALGKRQGVADADLKAARSGRADDVKTMEALQFATSIVRRAGRVPHAEVDRLRHLGFTDGEIVDIIAAVALNLFRNYFNLVAGTDIDSPVVRTPVSA